MRAHVYAKQSRLCYIDSNPTEPLAPYIVAHNNIADRTRNNRVVCNVQWQRDIALNRKQIVQEQCVDRFFFSGTAGPWRWCLTQQRIVLCPKRGN